MRGKNKIQWPKKPIIVDTEYGKGISFVFTWQYQLALQMAHDIGTDIIGGPGAKMLGTNFPSSSDILKYHNSLATFTTRGCPNRCSFCAVPKLEGGFVELNNWRPAPIICDNNILASSMKHFIRVIDSVIQFGWIDFNQGLDCSLLKSEHLEHIARVRKPMIRFAFDNTKYESTFFDAITLTKSYGFKDIRSYVLIGYRDTPSDALYRLNFCKDLGVWPNPMRYQPIDTLEKNSYVEKGWTDYELKRMMKYWANLRITNKIPYSEFEPNLCNRKNRGVKSFS